MSSDSLDIDLDSEKFSTPQSIDNKEFVDFPVQDSALNADAEEFFPSPKETKDNEGVYNDIMSNITEIESTLSQINGKIEKLSSNRAKLFEEADRYQKELEDALKSVEDLQGKINVKDNELIDLTKQKENLDAEILTLKSKGEEGTVAAEQLRKEIEEKNSRIANLESEKNNLQGEQDKYKQVAEKDLKNLGNIQNKIKKINVAIKGNNDALDKLLNENARNNERGTAPDGNQGVETEVPIPEEPEMTEQEKNELGTISPEEEKGTELGLQGGGRKRLPIMYGGIKVPVWRTKRKAITLFHKYKRPQLNRIALKWGIVSPMKYQKKRDLAIAMKLLMHYRYGDLTKRAQIDRVAKIVGLKPGHYKSKTSLKRAINKRMSGMKMRGGSFFMAELKKGLKVKTPLLSGGQGKFLLMRKSSYLKGGSKQGRFLMKGGGVDKVIELQKRRTSLEKELSKARREAEKQKIRKKIHGLNSLINKMMGGGCGCMAGMKYKLGRRGGSAPLDHSMKSSYYGNASRLGNNTVGGSAPLDHSMKSSYYGNASRLGNNTVGGGLSSVSGVMKNMTSRPEVAAALGAASGGGKKRRKSKRKSKRKLKRKQKGGNAVEDFKLKLDKEMAKELKNMVVQKRLLKGQFKKKAEERINESKKRIKRLSSLKANIVKVGNAFKKEGAPESVEEKMVRMRKAKSLEDMFKIFEGGSSCRRKRKQKGGSLVGSVKNVAKRITSKSAIAAGLGAAAGVALVGGAGEKLLKKKIEKMEKRIKNKEAHPRAKAQVKKLKKELKELKAQKNAVKAALRRKSGFIDIADLPGSYLGGKKRKSKKKSRKSKKKSKRKSKK